MSLTRSALEQARQASPLSGVQLYTRRDCCHPHRLHLYSYIGMSGGILAQRRATAEPSPIPKCLSELRRTVDTFPLPTQNGGIMRNLRHQHIGR